MYGRQHYSHMMLSSTMQEIVTSRLVNKCLNLWNLLSKRFKVSLKASKKSNVGNTDVRIDCIVRTFKLVNNIRIYSTEEECTSILFVIFFGWREDPLSRQPFQGLDPLALAQQNPQMFWGPCPCPLSDRSVCLPTNWLTG